MTGGVDVRNLVGSRPATGVKVTGNSVVEHFGGRVGGARRELVEGRGVGWLTKMLPQDVDVM